MDFVVVSLLSPHIESLMPEILQRCTVLNVQAIHDGLPAEADQVYVTPPGFSVILEGGALYLRPLEDAQGHTIDTFFRSLAAGQGERAVGVVLSWAATARRVCMPSRWRAGAGAGRGHGRVPGDAPERRCDRRGRRCAER